MRGGNNKVGENLGQSKRRREKTATMAREEGSKAREREGKFEGGTTRWKETS